MQQVLPRLLLPALVRAPSSALAPCGRGLRTVPNHMTCTHSQATLAIRPSVRLLAGVAHHTRLSVVPPRAAHARRFCVKPEQPAGASTDAAANSAFSWKGFFSAPWTTVKQQWASKRAIIKNYGKFAVVLYFTVYVCTLGVIYSAVHFEIIQGTAKAYFPQGHCNAGALRQALSSLNALSLHRS